MAQFRVSVKVEAHEEYFVEADNEEQAQERFQEYLDNAESEFVAEGHHFADAIQLEDPEFNEVDFS